MTLYIHGSTLGSMWHLPVPGYDHVLEMAKLGHISIAIDQLGYGASGHPDGDLVCVGGNADIAHQIVMQLRNGDYAFGESPNGPAFDRVALAGNSSGGVVAEVAAYSFGDIDGLILNGAGDATVSLALLIPKFAKFLVTCARGGESPDGGASPPDGYGYLWPSTASNREDITYDMPPEVTAAFASYRERDPCGYQESVGPGLLTNNLYSWQIEIPVLLINGREDKVVGPQPYVGMVQKAKMIGSDDITLVVDDGEGHCGMIDARADIFRAHIAEWLAPRGL